MPTPFQKTAARVILGVGIGLAASILCIRTAPRRVSANVLDLVPADKPAPELSLIRNLAADRSARIVLIALDASPPLNFRGGNADRLPSALNQCVESLRRSGAFTDVEALSGGAYQEAIGRSVFSRRFDLLAPAWVEARWHEHQLEAPNAEWSPWLAERTADRLDAFLARPEVAGFQELLPSDPLLLVPDMFDRLQGSYDPTRGSPGSGALIWALSRDSPLDPAAQATISKALDQASDDVSSVAPGIVVHWTGVSRLAAASRERIEGEVSRLNILSLASVLLVVLVCVKRPLRALHLFPAVLLSMLGAWAVVMAVFDRVHVLVFVVGSLLCGVAIDYGFYIYLQPPAGLGETYKEKVSRLLRPLLASSLTVVLGFSLLLASELSVIRQVGVFVSAGLLVALASAILWFAQVDDPWLETRRFVHARARPGTVALRRAARAALALAGLVALAGPWLLTWRDDVRDLQIRAPGLEANDRNLRARFGDDGNRVIYFTQGDTPTKAHDSLDLFLDWHAREFPHSRVLSTAAILPTPQDWGRLPAHLAGLASFETDLRAALERHGFYPAAFDPFFDAWARWNKPASNLDYDGLVADFAGSLSGPASLMIACHPGACWYMTLADHPQGVEPPPFTHTISAHQLETLDLAFGRYRMSAFRLSLLGLGLVGLSVLAIYGWRNGLLIFAVPCGSCLFAFGVFGIIGHPLNLFNLLGAFLGVCLAHNYAIFTWENSLRGDTPPPSIRLSALCTAASFGVLATSSIPVVSALGSMVALIVLAALAAVELGPIAGLNTGLAVPIRRH